MYPTDADLVCAARAGDETSLAILLERHRASLHAMALRMLGHGPQAEDAVHDAFLIALRRLDDRREPAAFGAWLHTILRRACLVQLPDPRERPLARIEDLAGPALEALPEQALDRLAYATGRGARSSSFRSRCG